jgi:hypothetical protein
MSYADRMRSRITAAVVAAVALTVAGSTPATSWAAIARAAPGKPAAQQTGYRVKTLGNASGLTSSQPGSAAAGHRDKAYLLRKTALQLNLMQMPAGMVSVGQGVVSITMFGLTAGSVHTVTWHGNPIGMLTADAAGQASASFTAKSIPGGGKVKILDAGPGTAVIAQTCPLGNGSGSYRLNAIEAGFPQGSLRGHATLVYAPDPTTITVTLNASGLTPGPHAAHIHTGSCQNQGPVKYMFADFIADRHGNIHNQTRVATGVSPLMLNGGWYLNLHQGNSSDILSNLGQPTIFFRPLLCANV